MTEVTKLKRVVLPAPTDVLGSITQTLQMGEHGQPVVTRLELEESRRLIIVEVQHKGVALIPMERVASMVPMNAGEEKKYGITPMEQRMKVAAVEAERIAALKQAAIEAKAEEIRLRSLTPANPNQAIDDAKAIRAQFAKTQDVNTSFPGGVVPDALKTEAEKAAEVPAKSKTFVEAMEEEIRTTTPENKSGFELTKVPNPEDQPKKRGRKPGSKNKKKKS